MAFYNVDVKMEVDSEQPVSTGGDDYIHFPWLRAFQDQLNRLVLTRGKDDYFRLLKKFEGFVSVEAMKLRNKPKRATKFCKIMKRIIGNLRLIAVSGGWEPNTERKIFPWLSLILTHYINLTNISSMRTHKEPENIASDLYVYVKMILMGSEESVLDTVLCSTIVEDTTEVDSIGFFVFSKVIGEQNVYTNDKETFFKFLVILKLFKECEGTLVILRKALMKLKTPPNGFREFLYTQLGTKFPPKVELNWNLVLDKIKPIKIIKCSKDALKLQTSGAQQDSGESDDQSEGEEKQIGQRFFLDTQGEGGDADLIFDNRRISSTSAVEDEEEGTDSDILEEGSYTSVNEGTQSVGYDSLQWEKWEDQTSMDSDPFGFPNSRNVTYSDDLEEEDLEEDGHAHGGTTFLTPDASVEGDKISSDENEENNVGKQFSPVKHSVTVSPLKKNKGEAPVSPVSSASGARNESGMSQSKRTSSKRESADKDHHQGDNPVVFVGKIDSGSSRMSPADPSSQLLALDLNDDDDIEEIEQVSLVREVDKSDKRIPIIVSVSSMDPTLFSILRNEDKMKFELETSNTRQDSFEPAGCVTEAEMEGIVNNTQGVGGDDGAMSNENESSSTLVAVKREASEGNVITLRHETKDNGGGGDSDSDIVEVFTSANAGSWSGEEESLPERDEASSESDSQHYQNVSSSETEDSEAEDKRDETIAPAAANIVGNENNLQKESSKVGSPIPVKKSENEGTKGPGTTSPPAALPRNKSEDCAMRGTPVVVLEKNTSRSTRTTSSSLSEKSVAQPTSSTSTSEDLKTPERKGGGRPKRTAAVAVLEPAAPARMTRSRASSVCSVSSSRSIASKSKSQGTKLDDEPPAEKKARASTSTTLKGRGKRPSISVASATTNPTTESSPKPRDTKTEEKPLVEKKARASTSTSTAPKGRGRRPSISVPPTERSLRSRRSAV